MSDLALIVPARLASQRFPRKLLHPVRGLPLILWTARRLRQEAPEFPLHFAVAEEELAEVLRAEGCQVHLTDPALPSGTDRVAAANRVVGARFVVNVQADEPLVTRSHLLALADRVRRPGIDLATLAVRFSRAEDFADPNRVKVVLDREGCALYFSRSPIPYVRERGGRVDEAWLATGPAYLHLGLYAYTADFLQRFGQMAPGQLENLEKLEQLRALEHGCRIAVGVSDQPTIGIDTPEDVARWESVLPPAPLAQPAL